MKYLIDRDGDPLRSRQNELCYYFSLCTQRKFMMPKMD